MEVLSYGLSDGGCSPCHWVAVRAGEEHVGGYIWVNEKDFRSTPVSLTLFTSVHN